MRTKGLTSTKKAQLAAARAVHHPNSKDSGKKAIANKENVPCSPGSLHRKKAEKLEIKVRQQKNKIDYERKKYKRLQLKHTKLAESFKTANLEITLLQKATVKTMKVEQARELEFSMKVRRLKDTTIRLHESVSFLQKSNRALKMRCVRAAAILQRAISKARHRPQITKIMRRGTYTPEARALARVIAHSGCARERVGDVMKSTAKFFGITVKRSMSRRTVSRAVLEGGIATMVQQGFEFKQTDSALFAEL
jgi:hypothetical protein